MAEVLKRSHIPSILKQPRRRVRARRFAHQFEGWAMRLATIALAATTLWLLSQVVFIPLAAWFGTEN